MIHVIGTHPLSLELAKLSMARRAAWRVVVEARSEKITYTLCSIMPRFQNLLSNNVKILKIYRELLG